MHFILKTAQLFIVKIMLLIWRPTNVFNKTENGTLIFQNTFTANMGLLISDTKNWANIPWILKQILYDIKIMRNVRCLYRFIMYFLSVFDVLHFLHVTFWKHFIKKCKYLLFHLDLHDTFSVNSAVWLRFMPPCQQTVRLLSLLYRSKQ